ncbi:MAG TPA: SRPBCC domain-containing protein [Acidimicrobiia bacterium]|nr:SRPBCC domain-containing protein [Acidimicrobiia bacterium]
MTEPIVLSRRVAAPPAAVYSYLTESEKWSRWQGIASTIDARTGGIFVMRTPNGAIARGQFVELVPNERVVFTWGWVDHPGLPPGSSTVKIEIAEVEGGSLVTLTHRDLPAEEADIHVRGWAHYLPRLAAVAEGAEPVPDPGPPG